MSLVSVVHHLLISPLGGELRIRGVVVRALEVHLALRGVPMERVRLLVGVLVERGVVLLLVRVRRRPSCLLLLDWVRVWLLGDWGRRC